MMKIIFENLISKNKTIYYLLLGCAQVFGMHFQRMPVYPLLTQASFENVYQTLEHNLAEDKKEITVKNHLYQRK